MPDQNNEHICFYLPSLAGGGAERVFVDVANHIHRGGGRRISIVCANAYGPCRDLLDSGIEVVDLGRSRVMTSIFPLRRYLNVQKPDVVISAMSHANVGLMLAARIFSNFSGRLVVQEVAPLSGANGIREKIIKLLMRYLYPSADLVIAISKNIGEELNKNQGTEKKLNNLSILSNPIDLDFINKKSKEDAGHPWIDKKDSNIPVIISIGRLSREKDFPTLLQAFAKARKQNPLRLIILGEGKERHSLENMVKKLGISDDVSMPGFSDNPYAFLARADLLVVSSIFEGFAIALAEALACGCNVVTTNCGDGPLGIIENGRFGSVVPVGDINLMSGAILRRLQSKLAPEDLRRVSEKYDINKYVPHFLDKISLHTSDLDKSFDKEKICFYLPSLAGGGAEKLFVDLANHFDRMGYRVSIVCVQAIGPYLSRISPEIELINLNRSRVSLSILSLWNYLNKEKPDVVMANMSHANVALLLTALLPSRFRGRLVVEEVAQLQHGREIRHKFREAIVMLLMRVLYSSADSVVGISASISSEIKQLVWGKINDLRTISGIVDINEVTNKENENTNHQWLIDKNAPVIIGVGRFSIEKDFITLIAAFARVRENRQANLLLLGEGEQRKQLEALAEKLGVADDVSMPGFVDNPSAFLSRSDVFVLSSEFEGFGLVLIEAMAVGCNIVTTNCSQGPVDIVAGGSYGKIVPVKDIGAMAAAIEDRLDQPIAKEILRTRAKEFDVEVVGKYYLSVMLGKTIDV